MIFQPCLGVVLAGGRSSRMGQDKAFLTTKAVCTSNQELSMLSFSQQLLKQVDINNTVISGKNHGLADHIPNMGPLGGIYSVIKKHPANALLIMPIDLPLMTANCLAQLKQVGELTAKACYYQHNPLPLYLPINAFVEGFFAQHFEQLISSEFASKNKAETSKAPSINALLSAMPTQVLAAPKDQSLYNANTPEQWQYAKSQLTRRTNNYD